MAISILMASLLVSGRVAQGKPPTPDVRGWLQVNAPRSMADARL